MYRIRTTATITSIRTMPRVQKLLRDNGVYLLTEHRWAADILLYDISTGFLAGYRPTVLLPCPGARQNQSCNEDCTPRFIIFIAYPPVCRGLLYATDRDQLNNRQNQSLCYRNGEIKIGGNAASSEGSAQENQ